LLRIAHQHYPDSTYINLLNQLNLLEPSDRLDLLYPVFE